MIKSNRCAILLIERLQNENKDKTKTQMTQSFNRYSEKETKIWGLIYSKSVQSCVFVSSSFSFRNLSNKIAHSISSKAIFCSQCPAALRAPFAVIHRVETPGS